MGDRDAANQAIAMAEMRTEKPRGFFTLYRASGDAPYEAYFDHRPVRFQQAVCYRNYLRRSPDEALVIQALNPDFIQWFRQRVAGIPELPEPEAMCGEEGELWTRLWNTYR